MREILDDMEVFPPLSVVADRTCDAVEVLERMKQSGNRPPFQMKGMAVCLLGRLALLLRLLMGAFA